MRIILYLQFLSQIRILFNKLIFDTQKIKKLHRNLLNLIDLEIFFMNNFFGLI